MTHKHILGFPRIGAKRELKRSLESYWQGQISQSQLKDEARQIRKKNYQLQQELGLSLVTVGDFSYYDHVLDTSLLLGVIPQRFNGVATKPNDIDTLFSMARGKAPNREDVEALAMTKWFNTNYHYLVPEFSTTQEFKLHNTQLLDLIDEAVSLGIKEIKPVLLGPLSYLWLGRSEDSSFDRLKLLPRLIVAYNQILSAIKKRNINYIQIDEPILALELDSNWQQGFIEGYKELDFIGIKPIITTYFDDIIHNWDIVTKLPLAGLHIDVCSKPDQLKFVAENLSADKILSIGIVNGRNVWKNNLTKSVDILTPIRNKFTDNLWIASSCSLLHCPVDLSYEHDLNPEIKRWLAFATQKITEIVTLATVFDKGKELVIDILIQNQKDVFSRNNSQLIHNVLVKEQLLGIKPQDFRRNSEFAKRYKVQHEALNLPNFPTTTIGSFPQTSSIRKLRQDYKQGIIDAKGYDSQIKSEIKSAIDKQEKLGLDVLVHGEAERNDMVEYFGQLLAGFAFTSNGWVQSYGSRCVKPPIIYGDVYRVRPLTIDYTLYAQSLTQKIVKGMLTGPVTILFWSFIRDDQPLKDTSYQIALALRDEVTDLAQAGIKIIQIDEPAFREGLPLKTSQWNDYLEWATNSFRLASSGVSDSTQIHTHMCYSSFNDIIQAIANLDADVITIEASRGKLELLNAFKQFNYPNLIGPGVYDIHSPRIPTSQEIINQVKKMCEFIHWQKLWINPDCGLKTRNWKEVEYALANLVAAANYLRLEVADEKTDTIS